MAVVTWAQRSAELHLQGQHDQQTHGNRGGATHDLERYTDIDSDRPVFITRSEHDDILSIEAADGQMIELHVHPTVDPDRSRDPALRQRGVDMLNGVVTAYDMAPTSTPPAVLIIDDPRIPAPAAVNNSGTWYDRHHVLLNDNDYSGRWQWDKFDDVDTMGEHPELVPGQFMPVGADLSFGEYTGAHEYGHVRAALGDDDREIIARVRPLPIGGGLQQELWKDMSGYARTNAAEAHAEAFAEWSLSGGETTNRFARSYADFFGWGRDKRALAASAGEVAVPDWDDIEFLCDSPFDGPSYVTADGVLVGNVEFHLQGQHDQQTHGNRGGTATAARGTRGLTHADIKLEPWQQDLEPYTDIDSDRPVFITRSKHDDVLSVRAANGEMIELHVHPRVDPKRSRDPQLRQRGVDMLNGVADGYDMAPLDPGLVPMVLITADSRIPAPAAVNATGSHYGQNQVLLNDAEIPEARDVWESYEPYDTAAAHPGVPKGYMMPVGAERNLAEYTGAHEYGHVRAALGADDARIFADIKPMTLGENSRDERTHGVWGEMSLYARANAMEAHAEAFAEWAMTGGRTTNRFAQAYADIFGWGRDVERALAASAGEVAVPDWDDIEFLCDSPFDGPSYVVTGGILVGDVEFHLQGQHDQQAHGHRGAAPDIDGLRRATIDGDTVYVEADEGGWRTDPERPHWRRESVRVDNDEARLMRRPPDGLDGPEQSATVVAATSHDGTAEGITNAVRQLLAAPERKETFHLQGQHDQQTHGNRQGRHGPKALDDNPDRFAPPKSWTSVGDVEDVVTAMLDTLNAERDDGVTFRFRGYDGNTTYGSIDVEILGPYGDWIGEVHREFIFDQRGRQKPHMYAASIRVAPDWQSNGIGTQIQEAFEDFAAASGLDEVRLDAVGIGRYTWSRAGYDFVPKVGQMAGLEKWTRKAGFTELADRFQAASYEIQDQPYDAPGPRSMPDVAPTPWEVAEIVGSAGWLAPDAPAWEGVKPLRRREALAAAAGRSRQERLDRVRSAYDEWWSRFPAAAEGADDPEAEAAWDALLSDDDDSEFHLKGTANDHDQSTHAGGRRIAPVSGETIKLSVDADLTMDVLPDNIQAKVRQQFEDILHLTPDDARDHLLDMAEMAYVKGLPGRDWYQDAHDQIVAAGQVNDIDPEVAIAITAALSVGTDWGDNLDDALGVLAIRSEWNDPVSAVDADDANEWAAMVSGSTKRPNSTERARHDDTLATLYARDPKLAARYIASKIHGTVGYSYDKFFKATDLLVSDDPTSIDAVLNGTKIRSFYNNLARPQATDGDVTVDVHMQRAMANDHTSTTLQQKHERTVSIKERSSSLIGTPTYNGAGVGAMPLMADVIRQATAEFNARHNLDLLPHEFQAVVWTEQIAQNNPKQMTKILRGDDL